MNKLKNNNGFTLVEMLIVLMIISVLIILIVPNLSGQSSAINEKGCDALTSMVQAQVDAYYIEHHAYPGDLDDLVEAGFIKEEQKVCPNGQTITLNEGAVGISGVNNN
ncbi:competence type IV pilus major pilin ComGC [Oceanobacillus bengalensis]|uniref:ComG operon protein 3 n=1 Tax=Oceanobacillus bengalensis TaxID=1435466 RepID=A0A494Z0G6_9BACI|nr:competence type IV pilus major pilin ComGC [Oceanobacillus bengalensis]RKQ16021.1 prepilin-type N-terminal cleavage/methylation domain-containing protein [Oceanobacillus bengalensis]